MDTEVENIGASISSDLVASLYEPLVAGARDRYMSGDGFASVTEPSASAEFLDRFLIEFCARGVGMTEPVDRWITRAGEQCCAVGMTELGNALQRHAEHEAGHHLMMINDTCSLVSTWNRLGRQRLDADTLLARRPSPGVNQYVALHESTITSSSPWDQLAIEYEIERLSITAGPELMGRVAETCGPERVQSLTFLADHIALDEGHTVFNRRQLNQLLAEHPEFAAGLGAVGSAALDAHRQFIDDCAETAKRWA